MSKALTYDQLSDHVAELEAELAYQKALPVPVLPSGGIELAIKGLSMEIESQLRQEVHLSTFENVKQLSILGHQVMLMKALLRELSLEEMDAADLGAEDLAGCRGNYYPGMNPGGPGAGLVQRVNRRRQRRAAGGGGPVANQGYGHPQGFGRNGIGAPYNAWMGDVRDEPGNPLAGMGGMFNGIMDTLNNQNKDRDEREAKRARFVQHRNLADLIKSLKATRNELTLREGDEAANDELVDLNQQIDKLVAKKNALLKLITEDEDIASVPGADATPTPTAEDYLADARLNHYCTNPVCDQVQGPHWKLASGAPLDCDICGAPMRGPDPEGEKEQPNTQTDQPAPATVDEAV